MVFYTADDWIEMEQLRHGVLHWDEAEWQAWGAQQALVDVPEGTPGSPSALTRAERGARRAAVAAEADLDTSPTQSEIVAASDFEDTILDVTGVLIGFGKRFAGCRLSDVHRDNKWWVDYVVKEKIYENDHGAHLYDGLRLLGYKLDGSDFGAKATSGRPPWSSVLPPPPPAHVVDAAQGRGRRASSRSAERRLAEVRVTLQRMKTASVADVVWLLDDALKLTA